MIVRRTPCVGICSTTYGDLVCRGCKRHAHEIVNWNGLDAEQRERIWLRLRELRDGAVACYVDLDGVDDAAAIAARAAGCGVHLAEEETIGGYVYYLLRAGVLSGYPLRDEARQRLSAVTAPALLALVDREFEQRAVAQYEYAFRRGAR